MAKNNRTKILNFLGKKGFVFALFLLVFLPLGVVSNTSKLSAEGEFVDLNFIVKNQSGNPISGASINLDQDFGNGSSRTTDGGGFANFGVWVNTPINYSVSANGCSTTNGSVFSDQSKTLEVVMDCTPVFNIPSGWTQDIQYSINDAGNPVVGYYNVKTSGNKVFNWNVNVHFNGPGSMHVRTIGAYDEQSGSAATVKHPFGVTPVGTTDYNMSQQDGSFSFSYDTSRDSRLGQCGRVQIDGSFIDDSTGSDNQLFFAMIIDYGVDCVPVPANNPPVLTLIGSNPVTIFSGSVYTDAGAIALDPEEGNITPRVVRSGSVNTSVIGTYTLTYNVSDSLGLAATPITRTVNVVAAPVNNRPVITLVGSNPVSVYIGSTYNDLGATALDIEDGDITANISTTTNVNTAVLGTYTVTYNVSDSKGLSAAPVTRTVNVVAVPVNNKPVISIIGFNPANVLIGDAYFDLGATALDIEDGDITANISTTTNLNINVVGSYLFTYNVSDSKGLAADPVSRIINVYPSSSNQCVIPDSMGDSIAESFGTSTEPAFSTIVSDLGIQLSSQRQYQTWHTNEASTTVTVTFLNGYTAAGDVFGYYQKGNVNSFVPLFLVGSGSNNTYSNVALATPGQTYVIDVPAGDIAFAIHSSVSGGVLRTTENALNTASGDYAVVYDIATSSVQNFGKYVIGFEDLDVNTHDHDYNDVVVMVEVNSCHTPEVNTPPVITLVGANPINIIAGDVYNDPGATAFDHEDGNITTNIVRSGSVDTSIPGIYTLTYNVSDSKGLAAVPVSRTVNVLEPTPRGSITFCMILADNQNTIATSSYGLPAGSFIMDLATSTSFGGSIINSRTWNTNSFVPNQKVILGQNDASCVTFSGLDLGTYYYSPALVSGSLWNTPKYSDAHNQPVNNVFDFYSYSPELFNADPADDSSRNPNSDGQIILDGSRKDQTVFVYNTFNPAPQCLLPEITSPLVASVTVNTPFTYTLTASSTTNTLLDVATSTLPAGLSYATSTHLISGIPTETGIFNIALSAANGCATTTGVLVLTVNPPVVSPSANLSITKIVDKTTVDVGGTLTYTITVTNNGTSDASGVVVTETFPTLIDLISATSTVGSYSTTTGVWTIGNLANGSTTTLTLIGAVKAGSENHIITNSVVVSSGTTDPDTTNNTSTVSTVVNPPVVSPSANLSITKIVDKTTVDVGGTLTYTITVTNTGSSTATNVIATESFPSSLNFVSATSTVGSYSTTTGVWTIGNLANGSTTTLTLVGTVKAGSENQTITNSVTVTSDTTDPDTANNTSTTTTTVNPAPCTSCGGGGGGTTPTVNLSVVKTADKTTANVGDTVTYTLNVSNSGPDNATNVSLTETFPSLLTLVSATSTVGSYSTTTGVWTIGNLANGSTTTLTLVATIKSGSEGQKITNTVTVRADQTDNNGSNNTSSVDLNVNTPPCTTCGGGGGGGSVPPANGPIVGSLANGPIVSQPQVQGEAAACYYLRDYLRRDFNNDPIEVKKLQVFLRELEGFNVETTGIYDEQTIVSLNAFQWRYKDDILTPWGHTAPTSYTYILTKKKVNEIYCKTAFPVTAQQQEEIDNYRNFLLSLRNEGISLPNTNTNGSIGTTTNTIISTSSESQVGSIDTSSGLTTLAGFSSTTQKITDNVADGVLYAGKRVANLALAFVAWPFGSLRGWFTKQCGVGSNIFAWISLLLVLIVMILSYVLYKQYKKQKTIDKINQEIDLN